MPTALVAGSTGLVGSHLLRILLDHDFFGKVIAAGRRQPPVKHKNLEFVKIDFDDPGPAGLPAASHVFCALGTTMKKAGSKAAFTKVDLEYPVHLAEAALKNGADHFYLVSSLGADKDSMFFYNKVKGRLEEAIAEMNFTSVRIFRPSLLLGKRTERRTGEWIGAGVLKLMSPLMVGKLGKYKGIRAVTVAKAMYAAAIRGGEGVEILEPEEIHALAATV